MSMFSAIGISGSGINAAQVWINTAAGNIANANDTVPTSTPTVYGQQTPVFTAQGVAGQVGDGVAVTQVVLNSNTGLIQYDPSSPMADSQGNVRVANVSVSLQLTGLIQAQNDYQANASALAHAKQAYQSALTLGS